MSTERERPVRLAVLVDAQAPDALVEALKEALRPRLSTAWLHIEAVTPGSVAPVESSADAVIGVAGVADNLTASLAAAHGRAIPTVVLALEPDRDAVSRRLSQPLLDTIAFSDPEDVVVHLGDWLSDRLTSKRIALAANFPFVRKAVAREAVNATAFQNAVIGGVMIIPGADMPLMTANQSKMLLQIAAAYGQPMGAERVKELVAVVGGGFLLRTVAREIVGLVPGFGWALKAGVGYTGTLAMGTAAIEYFEDGGDLSGLAEKVRDARDLAVRTVRTRRLPARGETSGAGER